MVTQGRPMRPARTAQETGTVATILEPAMRARLDTQGYFTALHANSLRDVLRTVRERPVQAVLVSPSAVGRDQLPVLGALVRQFPGLPAVAIVSEHGPAASQRLIELGACGVNGVVDLTVRDGWNKLRELVKLPAESTAALILGAVIPALAGATDETRQFFESLVRVAPDVCTSLALAQALRVKPSSFASRFFRASLPSPKRYLAATRLLYAAALFEVPGLSIADVAYRMKYSSSQSFERHVRSVVGVTAGEFRRRYTFPVALNEFTARLVAPFQATFRSFDPL